MIFNMSETNIGSGGDGWTLVYENDNFIISTTSTSVSTHPLSVGSEELFPLNKFIYVRIRDISGKRNGYFYGSDALLLPRTLSVQYNTVIATYALDGEGNLLIRSATSAQSPSGYGLFVRNLVVQNGSASCTIGSRYNSSFGTIDSTYVIQIFTSNYPSGFPSVFNE